MSFWNVKFEDLGREIWSLEIWKFKFEDFEIWGFFVWNLKLKFEEVGMQLMR